MKKHLLKIFSSLCLVVVFFACKKEEFTKAENIASLAIVYAVANAEYSDYKVNLTGEQASFFNSPTYSYYREYGNNSVANYFGLRTVSNAELKIFSLQDSVNPIYTHSITPRPGEIYTLFLAGYQETIDTLLLHETIPSITDTLTGIRFINLSPDAGPVSINLAGAPFGSEVSGLGYKQITNFKFYNAYPRVESYVFEFRNAATNDLLATIFLGGNTGIPQFKNLTIVLRGLVTANPGIQVVRANNY